MGAADRRGQGGVPRLAGHLAGPAHPDPVRVPRAAQRPQGRARRDHHRRARQGALRRARRGLARPGGRGVRLRHAAPAQGVDDRERLDRRRRALGAPAARRGGHHQPVQLPGHGADVVLPDRHRGRQHRHPQAEREGPDRGATGWPSCGRRPGCPTASSTSCTATRRRSTRCSPTPTSPRSPSSGSTPIAKYVYETGTAHGKRVQALGGAKNHMVVLPDADLDLAADQAVNAGFGSAGERCMAISAVLAVGEIADELVAKIADRAEKLHTGDGTRGCDMGPLVTVRGARPGLRLRRRRRGRRGQARRRRARRAAGRRRRAASSSARRCSTTSTPTCRSTPTRSSGRC